MSVECPALCLAHSNCAGSSCFLIIIILTISQFPPSTHRLLLVFLNPADTLVCVIIFLPGMFTFSKTF